MSRIEVRLVQKFDALSGQPEEGVDIELTIGGFDGVDEDARRNMTMALLPVFAARLLRLYEDYFNDRLEIQVLEQKEAPDDEPS